MQDIWLPCDLFGFVTNQLFLRCEVGVPGGGWCRRDRVEDGCGGVSYTRLPGTTTVLSEDVDVFWHSTCPGELMSRWVDCCCVELMCCPAMRTLMCWFFDVCKCFPSVLLLSHDLSPAISLGCCNSTSKLSSEYSVKTNSPKLSSTPHQKYGNLTTMLRLDTTWRYAWKCTNLRSMSQDLRRVLNFWNMHFRAVEYRRRSSDSEQSREQCSPGPSNKQKHNRQTLDATNMYFRHF